MSIAEKRKRIEAMVLKDMNGFAPGTGNVELYKEVFKSMNNVEFAKLMDNIELGYVIPIFVANIEDGSLDHEKIMAYGKTIGAEYESKIRIEDPHTGQISWTRNYMVLDLLISRLNAHGSKGISTSENNDRVDHLTGQATGTSKASSMSQPELGLLNDQGYKMAILELFKVGGGDEEALALKGQQIEESGKFSMKSIIQAGTTVKAVSVLKHYLLAAGLDNNADG